MALSERLCPDIAFAAALKDILDERAFDPHRLELAIHEEALASENMDIAYALGMLRDMGVRLWLSRFGQEISSLSLLKERVASGLITGVRMDALGALRSSTFWSPLEGEDEWRSETSTENFFSRLFEAFHVLGLKIQMTGVATDEMLVFAKRVRCDEVSGRCPALLDVVDNLEAEGSLSQSCSGVSC